MSETVREAAKRLFAPWIAKGYKPVALHADRGKDGAPIYYRGRLEHPDGDGTPHGKKVIRPIKLNGAGYVVYSDAS